MSDVLDVAIGLVLTWFLLSLAVSAVDEALAWMFRSRAKVLWRTLGRLFTDLDVPGKLSTLVVRLPGEADVRTTAPASESATPLQRFHDRVSGRTPEPGFTFGRTRISHIPAEIVSDTLHSMAAETVTKASLLAVLDTTDALRTLIEERLADGPLHRDVAVALIPECEAQLDVAWAAAMKVITIDDLLAVVEQNPALSRRIRTVVGELTDSDAIQAARAEIERWFEGAMDGATRLYRRQHRKVAAGIAAVVVLFANADSIGLLTRLREDRDLRAAASTAAADWAAEPLSLTDTGDLDISAICERIGDDETTSHADSTPPATSEATATTSDTVGPTATTTTTTTEADPVDEARRRYQCATSLFASSELLGPFGLNATWDEIRAADESSSLVSDVRSFFTNSGPWGRVLTWVALLFGASFWYDVLRRMVGLKGTSKGGSSG